MGIITFISDFGTRDGYAGVMKGVILGINPEVRLVDITHEISPQDIFEAALVLKNSYSFFPNSSIHLVIVDPGVGSERKPILVETDNHFFVGPDNGVFGFIYEVETIKRVVELTNKRYFLPKISDTFHGRDIFAAVAAYLSLGTSLDDLGERHNDVVRIDIPKPEIEKEMIKGIFFHIDRFGNLVSNIPEALFKEFVQDGKYEISFGGEKVERVCKSYLEVGKGGVLAVFGSFGYLEISVRDQSAQAKLRLCKGSEVKIERRGYGTNRICERKQ